MTAAALAYAATLAFAGWVLWLRDRKGETVTHKIGALNLAQVTQADAIRQLKTELSECRTIVDNLQLRSGLTSKR